MSAARLVVGAMSGTSADGVDAALVRITGRGSAMTATLVAHEHEPYPEELRQTLWRLRGTAANPANWLADLARLGRAISLTYAAAVRRVLATSDVRSRDVAAVAAHGQTLFHEPPDTIQWLDPARLAHETGCAVVSDFRRADCAAGGQGAPLVPFADWVLVRDAKKTRVLLNLGGIANFTWLPAGAGVERVIAFDTGPGNCLSDQTMHLFEPNGPRMDAGGAIAARGRVIEGVVEQVLADPYFTKSPPKSTDVPAMSGLFRDAWSVSGKDAPVEDLLKSACAITARSVADAIARFCPTPPDELIASGGGVRNATIMGLIRERLPDVRVTTIDELGIPSEAKEAVAFALLGAATLDGEPSNVPAATGASRSVVLGSITPRPY